MPKNRLIGHSPGTSSPGRPLSGGRVRSIPDDLLREAAVRLGTLALIGVALWSLGVALSHYAMWSLDHADPRWHRLESADAVVAVGILSSLALFLYTRRSRQSHQFLLDLGLVYMVVTSLEIAIIWHRDAGPERWSTQPVFTWVGALALMFAAILPNPPVKTLVAGLLAASMNPLEMLLLKARGVWNFGPPGNALLMHVPDYIMVGVSVVISRIVTRLGQHVSKAREMGSYHLGELLGRGGMGEVYTATHRMLARPAAIKLIRSEMIGDSDNKVAQLALKRFRREAEVAANLRSPHTVELYDFGVTESHTLYFVMELLEGLDLEALVKDHGPLPANRVIYILRQVCESLEEAHQRGLVHRDIKPANIHLGRLGLRHDFVKVLDFGLVKPVADTRSDESLGTAAGITPGTPDYMAPEIAMGAKIDARADLYALGCVAYYLLTGRLVFEVRSALEAIARHLNDTPVAPSQRSNQPIPPALDRLVLALLAKRPDDRPASAAELDRALAAIEIEPWNEEQAAAWWSRLARS
jgi:serine/threonine-protein kinase